MIKVYTTTGDDGSTALIGGERVPKYDVRVECYGTVDELSACVAMLGDMMREDGRFAGIVERFDDVQKDLMVIESMMAASGEKADGKWKSEIRSKIAPLPDSAVKRLEKQIDEMNEGLPSIKGFVIPGGHPIVSMSHICRTVCRRAERICAMMQNDFDVPRVAGEYLNRLSDWLYVIGRKSISILSIKEIYWMP